MNHWMLLPKSKHMCILFTTKSHHISHKLDIKYVQLKLDFQDSNITNLPKPWPIVEKFLTERVPGSIGIDVGCGNGKYLGVNKNVVMIGSDRSDGLITCAKELGHEVMVSDGLSLPHPDNRFVSI